MNLRQIGWAQFGGWILAVALAIPAWAGERPASISGYVRNASGAPQMGAVVKITGAAESLTVFTDDSGHYTAAELLPGLYSIRVWAPSFLPSLTEKIGLKSSTAVHVNVTLTTLLDALQMGTPRTSSDGDDWKWTLRSVANRPVLRVFDNPGEQQAHTLKASVSFLAGSAASGYGSGSDMSTGFTVERPIFSADRIALSGNVGYGDSLPAAALRASYSHRLLDGSGPSVAVTMRRYAPSDPNLHYEALQAFAMNAGDDVAVGDVLELHFGSELQTIQFLGHMTAFRPYGSAAMHLSPDTVLQYQYATSLPTLHNEQGLEASPDDLSDADPRVSMSNYATRLERAHHQELSVSHRSGNNSVQVAVYSDRVNNTALVGTGAVTSAGGFLLPDMYSGTFTFAGDTLDTNGVRLVMARRLLSDLTATFDYAYGGTLDLSKPGADIQDAPQWIGTVRRHALSAKLSGKVPHTRTSWMASYRWVNGQALTPVDMFNASPGQSDAFVNVFVRQPIPTLGFLPAHMEALIDVHNLLAQGYVPVMGQDGQTVYLVQAARSVRGGLSISF